ncbi:uncharacterized protein LOC134851548 [Symsagittifera roscoffensis]|uniref:uncharacterized protein LOC134851548 n=1 Tax=Symsagittifera roscoffensis TaxID=84072 RepID=UPI00307B8C43
MTESSGNEWHVLPALSSLLGLHSDVVRSLLATGFYAFMSGAMAFMNKNLVSNYNFNCPMFILLIQFLILVFCFEVLKTCKVISLSNYSMKLGSSLLLPSVCYIASSSFALLCLNGLNIPMYNVLKRLCPLFNVFLGYFLLHKYHISAKVFASVLLITLGSILAGYGDLSFQLDAYAYGILSSIAQSIYLLMVQKSSKEDNLSVLDISYITAVNAFPLCLSAIFIFDEFSKLRDFHGWFLEGFLFHFSLVTVSGTVLVYSQFLCTAVTSALTTSLGATMKSVLTTIIGFFTFGGVHVNGTGFAGIILNTLGGVLYTFFKYIESQKKSTSNISTSSKLASNTRNENVGVRKESTGLSGYVEVDLDGHSNDDSPALRRYPQVPMSHSGSRSGERDPGKSSES